jgi:hypothetical protein
MYLTVGGQIPVRQIVYLITEVEVPDRDKVQVPVQQIQLYLFTEVDVPDVG